MFEQFPCNPPLHRRLWPPAVAAVGGCGDYGGVGSVDDILHPGDCPAGDGGHGDDDGRQDYVDVAADFSSQHHPYQLLTETDWQLFC